MNDFFFWLEYALLIYIVNIMPNSITIYIKYSYPFFAILCLEDCMIERINIYQRYSKQNKLMKCINIIIDYFFILISDQA